MLVGVERGRMWGGEGVDVSWGGEGEDVGWRGG